MIVSQNSGKRDDAISLYSDAFSQSVGSILSSGALSICCNNLEAKLGLSDKSSIPFNWDESCETLSVEPLLEVSHRLAAGRRLRETALLLWVSLAISPSKSSLYGDLIATNAHLHIMQNDVEAALHLIRFGISGSHRESLADAIHDFFWTIALEDMPEDIIITATKLMKIGEIRLDAILYRLNADIEWITENCSAEKEICEDLLQTAMEIALIPGREFEQWLHRERRQISVDKISFTNDRILRHFSAIAQQFYLRNYLTTEDINEDSVESARRRIELSLASGAMPQANDILHYASYKSLETISLGSQLFSFANKETLNKLFVQQILNPKLERFISSKILICAYDDATRSNVLKGFYHEYPYPQWSYLLNRHKFESAKDYITSKIGYEIDSFNPDNASRILIAGSGTGIHAIDVASKLPSCEIFAIDISLNSLAFAKRKAIEMQIENISFLCADLRNAHLWKGQFDFIECAGVLHHLESPAEGLFSLRDCLKKNGMLLLGLYSANGRRDLAILKEMFPQHEDEEPASYCRRIRSIVMEDVRFSSILKWVDFYSLNGCADLFMNPVERNYDLTEISRIMADFNLTLRGFELNNWQRTFLSHYEPESLASWSFEDWAKIEDSERDFFAGMYQFWVQKA